jgi:hypothetical protein
MSQRRKRLSDGLRSKVTDVQIKTDRKGKYFYFCTALQELNPQRDLGYVPVCTYRMHQGPVEALDVCKRRSCGMLRKVPNKKTKKLPLACKSLIKVYLPKRKGNYVNRAR